MLKRILSDATHIYIEKFNIIIAYFHFSMSIYFAQKDSHLFPLLDLEFEIFQANCQYYKAIALFLITKDVLLLQHYFIESE